MSYAHRHEKVPRVGYGCSFGTFGELLQGVLPNDQNFLITLPIQRYTRATFTPNNQQTVQVQPLEKQKSRQLAMALLTQFDLPTGGMLVLNSDVPVGKGFASSSCDLVATARAVADAYQLPLAPAQIERLIAPIEPTDGVMYEGYVVFYHREVRLGVWLGSLPMLTIVSVDEGGEIDTVEFNKIPKPFDALEKDLYHALHDATVQAFARQDIVAIGEIATRSAELNQKLRPKALLNDLIRLNDSIGGLGVATAHSGTVSGVLLTPLDPRYPQQLASVQQQAMALAGNTTVYETQTFLETLTLPQRATVRQPAYLKS